MPLWRKSKNLQPLRQSLEMASALDLNTHVQGACIIMVPVSTISAVITYST